MIAANPKTRPSDLAIALGLSMKDASSIHWRMLNPERSREYARQWHATRRRKLGLRTREEANAARLKDAKVREKEVTQLTRKNVPYSYAADVLSITRNAVAGLAYRARRRAP
jgi:hypothetical protein